MLEQGDKVPLISLVVPMYNEASGVAGFFERALSVLGALGEEWEVLAIDDGSTDDTRRILAQWSAREPRIRYLALSRNFGKEAALTAGIEHAMGRVVVPIDADLQDPPELIPQMLELWRQGNKVVLATRRERRGEGVLKRGTAWLFYRLMARLTSVPVPYDAGDFRLMDRSVVEVLRLLPERTRFMKGLFAWVGFKTISIHYDREPRHLGVPKQSWGRLWGLAKDGVFSFTTFPLKLTTYLGVLISVLAFGYAFWLLLRTLILGVDVPGYASIMAAILCMGGIQLVALGILGEYIGRIYREAKQRPIYIIEERSGEG